MAQESLVKELRDSGWEFLEQFTKRNNLDAAFWMPSEEGWFLCISTYEIETKGPKSLYQEIRDIIHKIPNDPAKEFAITPDDVYILNPMSLQMQEMRRANGVVPFRSDYVRNLSPHRPYIYCLTPEVRALEYK
jgi:hypothetical protein